MLNYNIKKEELSMIYGEIGNGIKVRTTKTGMNQEKNLIYLFKIQKKKGEAWMSKYVAKYYIKKQRTY